MAKKPGAHVREEITQQPNTVAQLLETQRSAAQAIAKAIRNRDIHHVVIAARGTSDNAARYAQYVWGGVNRLNVALATPSLWSVYATPPHLADCLVVGISQSGQSPDIVAVVEDGARQGGLTLAITNDTDSPLAGVADHILDLGAGVERAVAATKTYTAELAAVALLAATMADDAALSDQLASTPRAMSAALTLGETTAGVAEDLASIQTCLSIGRGHNLSTAFELALKLQEMCYVTVGQYSSADFRHGPMALASPDMPALIVAPAGAVAPGLWELAHALRQRRVRTVVISDLVGWPFGCDVVQLPIPTEEWLSPLTAVIPGQLFALHLALAKGLDPDVPRGLSKVTRTR